MGEKRTRVTVGLTASQRKTLDRDIRETRLGMSRSEFLRWAAFTFLDGHNWQTRAAEAERALRRGRAVPGA